MAKSYLRLIEPAKLEPSAISNYVIDYRHSIEWVEDSKKATADYRSAAEVAQKKLKKQLDLDTELLEIPDPRQMQSKFVISKND
jgi:hypothetical protein